MRNASAALPRRIRSSEWQELKRVRLEALQDSPTAFGSTFAHEATFDDNVWIARAQQGESAFIGATWVCEPDPSRADRTNINPTRFVGIVKLVETDVAYRNEHVTSVAPVDIVSMWVAAEYRGSSTAASLLNAALDEARLHGCPSVGLWVTDDNLRAQRLYARVGFMPTGHVDVLPSNPCLGELRMQLSFPANG